MKRTEFDPPKLPLVWIGSTFIAPVLIVVLPPLFTSDLSLATRLIIALALLSVLLLATCFALTIQIYSTAYRTQIAEYKMDSIEEQLEATHKRLDRLEQQKGQHNGNKRTGNGRDGCEDIGQNDAESAF